MNKFISATQYCVSIFDGTHDTPKPVTNGYPLVTSKNILGGTLDLTNAYNISEDDYNAIQRRSAVSKWDVVFSMIGSIGETYLEKNEIIPYAIKNVGVFSCKDEHKAKWLYYYLISPYSKQFINNYLAGAVQKFLPLGTLRDFPVIPYDKSKRNILDLLSALDSKIELNNKINAELEALAKIIYDYWFVQFDFPDESGKPYKSSGGKMVWNEELKRDIPEGWKVQRLDYIEPNIVTGKTPSTANSRNFNGVTPFICITDLRQGMHVVKTEQTLSENGARLQKNKFIPAGSICVSCIASPGLIAFTTRDSQTNQQLNSVVVSKPYNRYFLYFYLTEYFKYSKAKTGNTFANMNKEDFSSILVIRPKNEVLKSFSKTIEPMGNAILNNLYENDRLAKLRDWLLPMLMNGQVTVGEINE